MTRKPTQRPKRLKVTVERLMSGEWAWINLRTVCWKDLRKTGVPALKPGESCKGWLSFEEEK